MKYLDFQGIFFGSSMTISKNTSRHGKSVRFRLKNSNQAKSIFSTPSLPNINPFS